MFDIFGNACKLSTCSGLGRTAAVPLIFDPVSVPHLYPTRKSYRVVLVDGSISDNTGLETLRDAGTTTMLMSNGGVEVPEDTRISFRQNPLAVTGRSMTLLMVQAEQDRLLAVQRSKFLPIVHMSLAFDSRFRETSIQDQMNETINIMDEEEYNQKKKEDKLREGKSSWLFSSPGQSKARPPVGISPSTDLRTRRPTSTTPKSHTTTPKSPPLEEEKAQTDSEVLLESTIDNIDKHLPVDEEDDEMNDVLNNIPHNNRTVISLCGVVRTHLDLFTEVECNFLMSVAYLEAMIKLTTEQQNWQKNIRNSKARAFLPWLREDPPWDIKYVKKAIESQGTCT